MTCKIDIEIDEQFQPVFRVNLIIPLETFEAVRIYKLDRDQLAQMIGHEILDDVEAFIAKRQNEQLHSVTK